MGFFSCDVARRTLSKWKVINLLLVHKESNQPRGSYLHHTLVPVREKALQLLGDEIDRLATPDASECKFAA